MKKEEKKEIIYVDQEGHEKMRQELENLYEKYKKNSLDKGEAYDGAAGDGWHDNFAFDEANRQEHMILGQIRDSLDRLSRTEIIEKKDDNGLVDINDNLLLNLDYGDEQEEINIRLVASNPNPKEVVQEVSINSPLGKAIYHKSIGENVSYRVNNFIVKCNIIKKINNKQKKIQE